MMIQELRTQKMKTLYILALAALLSPALAAAAPAATWDQAAPSVSGADLQAGFQALHRQVSAEKQDRIIYGVPQHANDAFAGVPACSNLDAQFLRAFTIDEAVSFLKPCADGLSQRYGLPVTAEKGSVTLDGTSTIVPGIVIHVPAAIKSDNHILMDLSYAIREQRRGQLLGFRAGVVSGSVVGHAGQSQE